MLKEYLHKKMNKVFKYHKPKYSSESFDAIGFLPSDIIDTYQLDWLEANKEKLVINGENIEPAAFINKIFGTAMALMVDDIIDRNITVDISLQGRKKYYMNMHMLHPKYYRTGFIRDITKDRSLGALMYAERQIMVYMLIGAKEGYILVSVDDERSERIRLHVKEGMSYGYGAVDHDLKYYGEELHKIYPCLTKTRYKQLINHVWRKIMFYHKYDADIFVKMDDGWAYTGFLQRGGQFAKGEFRYLVAKKLVALAKLSDLYNKEDRWMEYLALTDDEYQTAILEALLNKMLIGESLFIVKRARFAVTDLGAAVLIPGAKHILKMKHSYVNHLFDKPKIMIDMDKVLEIKHLDKPMDMDRVLEIGRNAFHWLLAKYPGINVYERRKRRRA